MLHVPGLSHRQHRKNTQDARQAPAAAGVAASPSSGLASTSTIQRSPIGGHGHGHDLYDAHAAHDPYAGQHVVAETHHLRYLPIKKRHGLFRKPTHHMYEFDTHFHGLHSAMTPHHPPTSTTTPAGAHGSTPTTAAATSTASTTTLYDERVTTSIAAPVTPPAPRRYGTDISTARMRNAPISSSTATPAANAAGTSSPLAATNSPATATGIERTQIATMPTTGTEGDEDRELLIKTTTRATPAIVDPVIVPVSARAETVTAAGETAATPVGEAGGEYYARQEIAGRDTYIDASQQTRSRDNEYYARQVQGGDTASVSTNDMYARAFEEESAAGAAGAHPPVMPAGEWVETHYRTESGRFEEVVRRD